MPADVPPAGVRGVLPRWRVPVFLMLLAVVAGCGGPEGKEGLVPAYGTVTLDGEPLVDAQVFFDHPLHPETFGRTDSNGYYEMAYTYTQEGAFTGENIVSFAAADIDLERGQTAPEERVPRRYLPNKSTLKIEVTDGGGPYDFALTTTEEAE